MPQNLLNRGSRGACVTGGGGDAERGRGPDATWACSGSEAWTMALSLALHPGAHASAQRCPSTGTATWSHFLRKMTMFSKESEETLSLKKNLRKPKRTESATSLVLYLAPMAPGTEHITQLCLQVLPNVNEIVLKTLSKLTTYNFIDFQVCPFL